MYLLFVWRPHILPLDHQMPINSMIRFHLKWWMDTNRFVQGMPIQPPDPNAFLYMDASHYRWGAHLEPMRLSFHGRKYSLSYRLSFCWSEDQSQLHISILEIMAIRFALKKLKAISYVHHSCVMISTDNTTVVSYINKQGGTHSHNLCVEVWKIFHWCRYQSWTYPRQIQYFGRSSLENGQAAQNRMGIGSIDWARHFPNA